MQNKIQFGFQRPKNHTHIQKQHSGINGSHFIYTQNVVVIFSEEVDTFLSHKEFIHSNKS